MFEMLYFTLGLINNLFLIAIFLVEKYLGMSRLPWLGRAYLLLGVPAIYGIVQAQQHHQPYQYSLFLGIFIAYLLLEAAYDQVFKIQFRTSWKLLTPFLALYWMMNYGFVVMAWKSSVVRGAILLGLFILQLLANILSHRKGK